MTVGPRLLVRTDGTTAIGLGHAMRCLALVQALGDDAGGRAVFLMHDPPSAFTARAAAEEAVVVALDALPGSPQDRELTLATASAHGAPWIVLDGYHFDGAFQAGLVAGGARLLAFDDHGHAGRYHADLVLNQNLGATAATYARREPRTQLLLGPRHALLRREFRRWSATRDPVPERARRVLVTFGGSDPADTSTRVVDALAHTAGPPEVEVLAGAANPHAASLAAAAARSPHRVRIARDVRDMPGRMARADLAVTAAGGTSWELARVGTPQIALAIADNQRPTADALAATGAAVGLGWHADVEDAALAAAIERLAGDRAARAELSRRGRALVDGAGAARVLAAMGSA